MATPCRNDRGELIDCAKVHEDGTRTMRRLCACDVFCGCLCAEDQTRPTADIDARDRQGLGRVYAAMYGGGAVYTTETPEGREQIDREMGWAPTSEPVQEPATWAALPRVSFCDRHPDGESCDCREEDAA